MAMKTGPAQWHQQFLQDVSSLEGELIEVVVATSNPNGRPSARYCVHAGFWSWNSGSSDRDELLTYNTDCPFFVTDRRTRKIADIFGDEDMYKDCSQGPSQMGGGGPIALVYWFKDLQVQWIISGFAWVLSYQDIDVRGDEIKEKIIPFSYLVEESQRSSSPKNQHETSQYTGSQSVSEGKWRPKIEEVFDAMADTMRGSFRNPAPGGLRPSKETTKDHRSGLEIGGKAGFLRHERTAQENFRIVVVAPDHVEAVYMSPEKRERTTWTLQNSKIQGMGSSSQPRWCECDVWP